MFVHWKSVTTHLSNASFFYDKMAFCRSLQLFFLIHRDLSKNNQKYIKIKVKGAQVVKLPISHNKHLNLYVLRSFCSSYSYYYVNSIKYRIKFSTYVLFFLTHTNIEKPEELQGDTKKKNLKDASLTKAT